ncbi:glycosyltransferase family 1 protein [Phototrophicus methaneseepsis]|uniref:Glycosyltransferase family 1 protein n=1 Tax=Phototrophicus methaneseepsis TaxID=2710758 RepID=A0A7S8IF21_9CHLR|nr:glycosyltransferase [Phototrophicus methaneseepsis]QPC83176.1 glycosyltransferase family 1 protein [Phototrophicus methaneseepsis]
MRIAMVAIGSRGDVQPLLALGSGLQAAGHEVAIAAGKNFQALVEDAGLGYHALQTDIEALMNSQTGQDWVEEGTNSLKEAQHMRRVVDEMGEVLGQDILNATREADCVIGGLTSAGHTQAVCEKFNKQHLIALFSPLNPTSRYAATMVPSVPKVNTFLNRFSGYGAQYFMHWVTKNAVNAFRSKLGLGSFHYGNYARLYNRQTTVLYAISPLVMPRPAEWGSRIHVTGYWFYDAATDWQPSPALSAFLAAGETPVYIGFGSMPSKDPQGTAHMMIDALQMTGQRGIIQSGWAGLQADDLPDDIFLLDSAPHDWLFPRMKAVIHHGGAGTTSSALRAGVPSNIIAHMADQPYWGQRVHDLGVSGPFVYRHKLTTARLAKVIQNITQDMAMKDRAQLLGQKIRHEHGVANAVAIINAEIAR